MALSIPNRFVNGQTVDAAKFNSNFDAITVWSTATDAAAAGVLTTATANANIGKGAFYAAVGAQVMAHSPSTPVTIECIDTATEGFDTDSWFNNTTFTYTPLVAGAYQFNIDLLVDSTTAAAGEYYSLYITKNTTTLQVGGELFVASYNSGAAGSIVLKANGTTDTFKVQMANSGALTLSYCRFSGFCVKPD